jgi:Bacterial cellulose synthase subunit
VTVMRVLWAAGATLLMLASAARAQAPAPEPPAPAPASAVETTRFTLEDLGFSESLRASATRGTVTLPLPTRGDRVLTAATLKLVLAADGSADGVAALEVQVNGERVALIDGRALAGSREHTVAIPPATIESRSSLALRLVSGQVAACAGTLPTGSWRAIAGGTLEMRTTSLRLPNDLGILPLPFFDPQFDRKLRVPVVFLRAPDAGRIRAAALLASYIGLRGEARASFPVSVGKLPAGHAMVLAEGDADLGVLGLPAPEGPALHLIDNPQAPGGAAKLLVVAGRNAAELAAAALALAGDQPLAGGSVAITPGPVVASLRDHDAPRWVPVRDVIPLGSLPGGQQLVHEGTSGTTFKLPFRLPPDLFFWHNQHPALELVFSEQLARGVSPPRVNVELNGHFVATLPAPKLRAGGAWGRVRLPLIRDHLAGYNELAIHLDYGSQACAGPTLGTTRFSVDSDSSGLRLRGHTHFASLPDLSLFVHDGFPFTRRADLGQTAAVLPARPTPEEIGSLLSLVAGFAGVTGRPASGLEVTTAEQLTTGDGDWLRGRDLLIVGAVANQPLLAAWGDRLPLRLRAAGAGVELPTRTVGESLRFALSGRLFDGERARAEDIVGHLSRFAAVMAIESPLAAGRAAVFVTAHEPAMLPALGDLRGRAESRYRGSDTLVVIGPEQGGGSDGRFMFRMGLAYDTGRLHPWQGFLWRMSQHWVALFPAALVGIVLMALVLRAALRGRVRRRLLEIGESVAS